MLVSFWLSCDSVANKSDPSPSLSHQAGEQWGIDIYKIALKEIWICLSSSETEGSKESNTEYKDPKDQGDLSFAKVS